MGYIHKYQTHGLEGIKYQRTNHRYTKKFKAKIVISTLKRGIALII